MSDVAEFSIRKLSDIVSARRHGRKLCRSMGFDEVDVARIVTAISELCDLLFQETKQGTIRITKVEEADRIGLEVSIRDIQANLPEMTQWLRGEYAESLGLHRCLSNLKLLMDEITMKTGEKLLIMMKIWKKAEPVLKTSP